MMTVLSLIKPIVININISVSPELVRYKKLRDNWEQFHTDHRTGS